MEPGYTILDHPADLGIESRGATLAEAFEQAAAALVSIIIDNSTVELSETRDLELSAANVEQLLVRWLTEILYLYDGLGFLVGRAVIHDLSPNTLRATLHGEPFSREKHPTKIDVKAVTYHQILVQENHEGGLVRVFLDI